MTTLFLEIPLTPVEGEKPATFPFYNMSGKPLSSPSCPSVEATGAAVLSPTWHPVSCWGEADPLFPAHVLAGTGHHRSRGSSAARGRKGVYPQKDAFPMPDKHLLVCGQRGGSSEWEAFMPEKWQGTTPPCHGVQNSSSAWRGISQNRTSSGPNTPCQSSDML